MPLLMPDFITALTVTLAHGDDNYYIFYILRNCFVTLILPACEILIRR